MNNSFNNFKMGFNQAMFNAKANLSLAAIQAKPYITTALSALRAVGTTIKVGVNTLFVKVVSGIRSAGAAIRRTLRQAGVKIASIAQGVYRGARGLFVKIGNAIKSTATKVKTGYNNMRASRNDRRMKNQAANKFSTMNNDKVIPQQFGRVRTAAGKAYDAYRGGIDKLATKIVPQRKVKQSASKYITEAKVKLASTPQRVVSNAIRAANVAAVYGLGQLGVQGIMNANSREDD